MKKLLILTLVLFSLSSCSKIKEKISRGIFEGKNKTEQSDNDEMDDYNYDDDHNSNDEDDSLDDEELIDFNDAGYCGTIDQKLMYKNMTTEFDFDFDRDGMDDTFVVGNDHPNGTRIVWLNNKTNNAVNIFYELPEDETTKRSFDEFGFLKEGLMIQLSISSANNKRQNAALISIGKKEKWSHTYVFVHDPNSESAVKLVDDFDSGSDCEFNPKDQTFYVRSNGTVKKHKFKI